MNLSLSSSSVPFRTRFFYGWVIVAVAGLGLFFSSPGQTYSISLFINAYIETFGWSRTFVSFLYSAGTLVSGLLLFFVGRLVDRHGGRKMGILIGLLLAAACMWNSIVVSPVMLFVGFFLLRYFGQGSMTLIPSTVVSQWFVRRRAFAFSMMSLGAVLASALIPPFNAWMIQTIGWNGAWRIWALLLVVLFVPITAFFMRNTPEHVGLHPDGASNRVRETDLESSGQKSGKEERVFQEEHSWTLAEAIRTRSFWLMLFCMAVPSMVGTGMVFHFVSILGERGIGETNAAYVLSVMAMVAFPSTFLAGFILDRLKVHHVVAVTFIGQVLSLVLLMTLRSFPAAIAFGVFRGLLQGFEAISGNVIWPNYYGRKHLGSIRGIVMTVLVIASALGPLPFGAAFDFFGGYREILLVMTLFPTLAVVASSLAPKPARQTP